MSAYPVQQVRCDERGCDETYLSFGASDALMGRVDAAMSGWQSLSVLALGGHFNAVDYCPKHARQGLQ